MQSDTENMVELKYLLSTSEDSFEFDISKDPRILAGFFGSELKKQSGI